MPQVISVKSLALRVLRDAADSVTTEKSCPTRIISNEATGTGQELGQTVGQMLAVPARVRGQDAVTETAHAETCWHCHGGKVCRCAFCALPAPQMQWQAGECGSCKGTGFLCWPERVQ